MNSSKVSADRKIPAAKELTDLRLPAFDSIPAAADLTNGQAFQLSLRHALEMLPFLREGKGGPTDPAHEASRFVLH